MCEPAVSLKVTQLIVFPATCSRPYNTKSDVKEHASVSYDTRRAKSNRKQQYTQSNSAYRYRTKEKELDT